MATANFGPRPELTAADHAFAALVDECAWSCTSRPELTEVDQNFALFCEQTSLGIDMFLGMMAAMQRPTLASTVEFRHGVHVACIPVPEAWRTPKPKLNAWQRAATKLAEQITMPLDELLARRACA